MTAMVEKVARALALSAGGAMTGPGRSRATDEFGWKGDGEHLEKYVDRHWGEHVHSAGFAIEAMRDPTQGMRMAGHAALIGSPAVEGDVGAKIGFAALGDAWRAMIEEAINQQSTRSEK